MTVRLLTVLVLAGCSVGSAQSPISFGMSGGAVLSKPSEAVFGTAPAGTLSRITYASVSGIIRIPLEGSMFLQSEPAYLRKGLEYRETIFGYTFMLRARADYVEIPVFLGWAVDAGPISPYVVVGPALGYKVTETWDFGIASGSSPYLYSRYDISLNGGAGVVYHIARPFSVVLQARYSIGLNQLNAAGSSGFRSSEVRLGAGLLFDI